MNKSVSIMRIYKYSIRNIDRIKEDTIKIWNTLSFSIGGAESIAIENKLKLELLARNQLISQKIIEIIK
tara:strand:- start:1585 stop:1791 length:207 start_codon:yes stop_codon:yes gene_type:complete